jgi:hypothetical protein
LADTQEVKNASGKKQRASTFKKMRTKTLSQELLNVTSEETKRGAIENPFNTNDGISTGQFAIVVNDMGSGGAGEE